MKAEKTIYARAIPESIEIKETYFYEKEISLNSPPSKTKQEPCGEIKVVVPYDGHNYLKRQAIEDVKKQIRSNYSDHTNEALIGYLAINQHDGTDLDDLLDNSEKYDSVPLKIPVRNETIKNLRALKEDKHTCIIQHEYQPKNPDLEVVGLDIKVFDDDIDLRDISLKKENLNDISVVDIKNLSQRIEEKVSGFGGDKNWIKKWIKNKLIIQINITLTFFQEYAPKQVPKINQISIQWPTITYLKGLQCVVGDDDDSLNLRYNPVNSSLEWRNRTNFLMQRVSSSFEKNLITYHNQPIYFLISQPGELYQQDILKGKIEIEIPEILLSGLKARFYQFDSHKSGILTNNFIRQKTFIVNDFELILDDVFHKRPRTISPELKFDKILLNDECIRIIESELEAQGFEYSSSPKIPIQSNNDNQKLKCLISAWRSEGIENMYLWIAANGEIKPVKNESKEGETTFTTVNERGELALYLLGRFTGKNHILLQRINTLQREIRKKFEKIKR